MRTMLRRLGEKGYLSHECKDRAYIYAAGEPPHSLAARAVRQIIDRFCRGSVQELIAGMVDAKDLFANAFKVVTERGTTYLMGRVTQREADRATDIARGTPGVQKVVRVLEIISEEELQGMLPKPAASEVKREPTGAP